MMVLLPILAAVCGAALWLLLARPRFVPLRSASPSAISIIIPARNEEANIGPLLESIRNQNTTPREVIVVDDDSTDSTASIAAGYLARVIQPPPIPSGWKGKTWACHHGAAHATGDWFLFLDADTRLEPGALERLAFLTRDPARVSSVCPFHHILRPYEQLSAFFNVIMLAGINAFGIQRDPSREAALFGQCLLIPKPIYQKTGGHEAVRTDILENFSLARHLEAAGIPRDCYLGRGTVTMRMFPGGFRELWSSWKKGFTTGAANTAPRALALTSIWIFGAMLACVCVPLSLTPFADTPFRVASAAAYLLHAALCLCAFRLAGAFSTRNALFFPVSLLFYQTLFFTAVIGRRLGIRTLWKGRHVD